MQRIISLALGACILALAAWLSHTHRLQADWTAGNRNSLTEASEKLLASLPDPIHFTAFVFPNAEVKREIEARIAPYQRVRPDITLEFVDPAKHPDRAREVGVGQSGEVVVSYQGRRENLRGIGEPTISAALQRLAYTGESTILFLRGHGERDPADENQSGYSMLRDALADKGLRIESFEFATSATIPEHADVVVLAAPQRALLPGEIARLADWVGAGGNLLWLLEPDSPPMPALAEALSLEALAGTVIYQDYELLGTGHPALALVADYGAHAITREMVDLTVFPLAAGLGVVPGSDWFHHRLATSPPRSWLEAGELEEQLIFEDGEDTMGPINLAFAMTRYPELAEGAAPEQAPAEQRVVVVADSDFLSNAFISQLGNRQLGINILQWLASRDAQIDIDVPEAPDLGLVLSPLQTLAIALFFVLLLPGMLLGMGIVRWWSRSRRRS